MSNHEDGLANDRTDEVGLIGPFHIDKVKLMMDALRDVNYLEEKELEQICQLEEPTVAQYFKCVVAYQKHRTVEIIMENINLQDASDCMLEFRDIFMSRNPKYTDDGVGPASGYLTMEEIDSLPFDLSQLVINPDDYIWE